MVWGEDVCVCVSFPTSVLVPLVSTPVLVFDGKIYIKLQVQWKRIRREKNLEHPPCLETLLLNLQSFIHMYHSSTNEQQTRPDSIHQNRTVVFEFAITGGYENGMGSNELSGR